MRQLVVVGGGGADAFAFGPEIGPEEKVQVAIAAESSVAWSGALCFSTQELHSARAKLPTSAAKAAATWC